MMQINSFVDKQKLHSSLLSFTNINHLDMAPKTKLIWLSYILGFSDSDLLKKSHRKDRNRGRTEAVRKLFVGGVYKYLHALFGCS